MTLTDIGDRLAEVCQPQETWYAVGGYIRRHGGRILPALAVWEFAQRRNLGAVAAVDIAHNRRPQFSLWRHARLWATLEGVQDTITGGGREQWLVHPDTKYRGEGGIVTITVEEHDPSALTGAWTTAEGVPGVVGTIRWDGVAAPAEWVLSTIGAIVGDPC